MVNRSVATLGTLISYAVISGLGSSSISYASQGKDSSSFHHNGSGLEYNDPAQLPRKSEKLFHSPHYNVSRVLRAVEDVYFWQQLVHELRQLEDKDEGSGSSLRAAAPSLNTLVTCETVIAFEPVSAIRRIQPAGLQYRSRQRTSRQYRVVV